VKTYPLPLMAQYPVPGLLVVTLLMTLFGALEAPIGAR
jgi:hypothetical protein